MARFNTDDYKDFDNDDIFDPETRRDSDLKGKGGFNNSIFSGGYNHLDLDKAVYIVFGVIWLLIVLNISSVLDWFFIMTVRILDYIIVILFIALAFMYIKKKLFK